MKCLWVLALTATAASLGAAPSPPTTTRSAPSPTPLPPTTIPSPAARSTSSRVYPVYPRPTIVYPKASWTSCTQAHCAADYHRCVKLFHGDGCSCYPGLLGCAINACNKTEYADVLDTCYDALDTDGRCALQCAPGYFPVDVVARSNVTTASNRTNATNVDKDDDTIREPVAVDWTVLVTWLLANTTADQMKNSSRAFVDTLVAFLQPNASSTLSAANIKLHLVTKSPTLQEVSAVVRVSSLQELNATDRALEALLFDEFDGDDNDEMVMFGLPDFGAKLVAANVVQHERQLETDNVKIQVVASIANTNLSNTGNSTAPPAQVKPTTNNNARDQTFLGLAPGTVLALAAVGVALLALIIVCLCLRCRKSSKPGQDKAAVGATGQPV